MKSETKSFFNRELTKDEWNKKDLGMFSNAEIAASNVQLSSFLKKVVSDFRRQYNISDTITNK